MATTPAQLKQKFRHQGKSFADWARQNGYSYHQVICVVNGFNKATRGKGHEIAVKLGLKKDTVNF
jgi:gp16 family phage-associated protein